MRRCPRGVDFAPATGSRRAGGTAASWCGLATAAAEDRSLPAEPVGGGHAPMTTETPQLRRLRARRAAYLLHADGGPTPARRGPPLPPAGSGRSTRTSSSTPPNGSAARALRDGPSTKSWPTAPWRVGAPKRVARRVHVTLETTTPPGSPPPRLWGAGQSGRGARSPATTASPELQGLWPWRPEARSGE